MDRLLRSLRLIAVSGALAACSEEATLPDLFHLSSASGEGTAIVTDAELYSLENTSNGWVGSIDYRYRNLTGQTISLLNCGGGYDVNLQQRQGDEWVTTWTPILAACLSPPIRIAPGDSVRHTMWVYGGRPGSNSYPQFSTHSVDGTYRLIIESAYWNYDHDGPRWGDPPPVRYRVSNSFELRAER